MSLSQISKYCRQKTIAQFIQAYVIGKLNYMVSAYLSSPAYQLSKLDKVILRAARISVGAYKARKMSNKQLLAECGFRSIRAYTQISGLNFFHKLVQLKKPENLYKKLKVPNRQCKNFDFSYKKLTKRTKNSPFFQGMTLYNTLPPTYRTLTIKSFKNKVKKLAGTTGVT